MTNDTPNFRLHFAAVGPQRTGTTWMDTMLREHAALCLPKDVKETKFFDHHHEQGLAWYAWHFRHCAGEALPGEVAPTYFDDEAARRRLRAHNPDCKIIITLRNPVERASSLYLHHRRKGRVPADVRAAARQIPRIIEAGRYSRHVPRWLDAFGPGQVLCVLLDDVKTCPAQVVERVCAFLEVEPIAPPNKSERVNAASLPRFPWLARLAAVLVTKLRERRFHQIVEWGKALGLKQVFRGRNEEVPKLKREAQRRLLDDFEEDVRFVEQHLERDLSSWRRPAA